MSADIDARIAELTEIITSAQEELRSLLATKEKPNNGYSHLSVRKAIRLALIKAKNVPMHYRIIAEQTGKPQRSVSQTLTIYPEFVRVHGSGWKISNEWWDKLTT